MSDALPRQTRNGTAFVDQGQGEALVLIHGVGLNADAWSPQIDAFKSTHRVIAIDLLGHGGSALPPANATLDDYVRQVAELLAALAITGATIVGHSMGGLVALGLAITEPSRVARVAVLNSVYDRNDAARAAVRARATELAESGSHGDIEQPLARWFGDNFIVLRSKVRSILEKASPHGYAAAYAVFATSDQAFLGKLENLRQPALFATGSDDPNSTPAMAEAMAAAAPRGKAVTLNGQRHMMNLTAPEATNDLIRNLLAEPLTPIDGNELRRAFGTFMTGVTVVTTRDASGTPRGFTANSFTSVSLDPPLLLVCIGKKASSYVTFSAAQGFAVNILAEAQKSVSSAFASKKADKFADISWNPSSSGNPLITDSAAWFDCSRHAVIDAGDHIILLGAVRSFAHTDASPLGYARGGYVSLGLEQAAVNAASGAHTIVGAILECDGKLLLSREASIGALRLPEVGGGGHSGSASLLKETLRLKGVETDLGFLFAVYETPQNKVQYIYYRGDALMRGTSPYVAIDFDAIAWDQLPDDATRIMLRRYVRERQEGRFKVYSGDSERGEVRTVT